MVESGLAALRPRLHERAVGEGPSLDTLTTAPRLAARGLAVLDWLPYAVLLVEASGRVVFANRTAEEMAGSGDGFSILHSEMTATTLAETTALRRLLSEVAGAQPGAAGHMGGNITLSRMSFGRPLSAVVVPLRDRCSDFPSGGPQPAAIVFITDPDRQHDPAPDLLRRLYGLTTAEAAVAIRISRGAGLLQVADELGVRLNTARTHLKHVLEKTGTHRQAELVRLLLTGPAGLRLNK